MSPRTRITTTVDFDVNPAPRHRGQGEAPECTRFWVHDHDLDMLEWLDASRSSMKNTVIEALDVFVEYHGIQRIETPRGSHSYPTYSRRHNLRVEPTNLQTYKWLNNQPKRTPAIRHAIRWYLSEFTDISVNWTPVKVVPLAKVRVPSGPRRIDMPTGVVRLPDSTPISEMDHADLVEMVGDMRKEVSTLTTAFYTLSGQLQQLIPGAHRA